MKHQGENKLLLNKLISKIRNDKRILFAVLNIHAPRSRHEATFTVST